VKLSRRQVATYVAEAKPNDRAARVRQAAAWLVTSRNGDQIDHFVHEVASVLAARGQVMATVTSARPLSPAALAGVKARIKTSLQATTVELESVVDPSVVGGIMIQTPDAELNATVRRDLEAFTTGARS
jgi:F0F1-type ATP synthase delta subunit